MAKIDGENFRGTWHDEAIHFMDIHTAKGYDYHGRLLQKVISPELTANPNQDINYRQIERLIEFLIDSVKRIKLVYAIAVDKNDTYSFN
jgi:hypothetical protein